MAANQPLPTSPEAKAFGDVTEQHNDLNSFLRSVEAKALSLAKYNVGNVDDALDIVQDAMIKLASRYGDKPAAEWQPLFFRVLSTTITDWHRKQRVKRAWFWVAGKSTGTQEEKADGEAHESLSPLDLAQALPSSQPENQQQQNAAMLALNKALQTLPERQRQIFLLRAWQQLDTKSCASALSISEGSVKTHYSRALNTLRESLGEHWP